MSALGGSIDLIAAGSTLDDAETSAELGGGDTSAPPTPVDTSALSSILAGITGLATVGLNVYKAVTPPPISVVGSTIVSGTPVSTTTATPGASTVSSNFLILAFAIAAIVGLVAFSRK